MAVNPNQNPAEILEQSALDVSPERQKLRLRTSGTAGDRIGIEIRISGRTASNPDLPVLTGPQLTRLGQKLRLTLMAFYQEEFPTAPQG